MLDFNTTEMAEWRDQCCRTPEHRRNPPRKAKTDTLVRAEELVEATLEEIEWYDEVIKAGNGGLDDDVLELLGKWGSLPLTYRDLDSYGRWHIIPDLRWLR